MGTQSVVEILPAVTVGQELIAVVDGQKERSIELLIVATVATLHPSVVPLSALGVAGELPL
jgi:hypothetical protein